MSRLTESCQEEQVIKQKVGKQNVRAQIESYGRKSLGKMGHLAESRYEVVKKKQFA